MSDTPEIIKAPEKSENDILRDSVRKLLGLNTVVDQIKEVLMAPDLQTCFKNLLKEAFTTGMKTVTTDIKSVVLDDEITAHLRGLLSDAVVGGVKDLSSDADYLPIMISVVGDSLVHFLKNLLSDPVLESQALKFGIKIMSDESVKGSLAEAVYQGVKRLSEDTQAQQAIATVANMVASSQPVANLVDRAVQTSFRRMQECVRAEVPAILAAERDTTLSKLQDIINVCMTESVQDLKNLKLTLAVDGQGK